MGKIRDTVIELDENKVTKKAKPAVVLKKKKSESSDLEKLKSHANKHITAWYSKSGDDRIEFAKHIAKHARALMKQ